MVYNYNNAPGRIVELYDMNGRIVNRTQMTSTTTRIETSRLLNGVYVLKITGEKGQIIRTEKMIVFH
jgi:hypothetical protein